MAVVRVKFSVLMIVKKIVNEYKSDFMSVLHVLELLYPKYSTVTVLRSSPGIFSVRNDPGNWSVFSYGKFSSFNIILRLYTECIIQLKCRSSSIILSTHSTVRNTANYRSLILYTLLWKIASSTLTGRLPTTTND